MSNEILIKKYKNILKKFKKELKLMIEESEMEDIDVEIPDLFRELLGFVETTEEMIE